jgi:stage V sporulation protein G
MLLSVVQIHSGGGIMEITEVRIKLVMNPSERLRAFCSITLDGDFVIRDLKIIEGVNGVFVAMPSRKLADRCPRCGCKNHLRAKYCNECGLHLKENRAPKDAQGRAKLHADIAHPINAACRERIQAAVVEAYEAELECSKQPGYKPQSFDDLDDFDSEFQEIEEGVVQPPASAGDSAADPLSVKEEFSDYNSLIADLKRDAADRRQISPTSTPVPNSMNLPGSEGENAIGKPVYAKRAAERAAAESKAAREPAPAAKSTGPQGSGDTEDGFGAGLV